MTSLEPVRKRRQILHARDMKGLIAFCFCPLEEEIVNKLCFPSIYKTPILRPDKHAEVLKNYFNQM